MTGELYRVRIKNSAKKDLVKIKRSYLRKSFEDVVAQLKVNPYETNQSFEKLIPPIDGFYSRRLNSQHRVVYKVVEFKGENIVEIYSAWSHYE